MVLHHVAERARALIVTSSTFNPEHFGRGNLDMIDVATVPNRFENRVRKPKDQNVLGGFFSEEVIDPIGLVLRECAPDNFIQLPRGSEISAEGLYHDDPCPTSFRRF